MSITPGQLRHTVSIYRDLPTGVGIQKKYQIVEQNVSVMIQPFSAEYANKLNMAFGRGYNMFAQPGMDCQISDKVIDQDGKEYRVTGSLNRNYGSGAHITFILTEQVKESPDH